MKLLLFILILVLCLIIIKNKENYETKKILVMEDNFDQGLFGQILNLNEFLHYLYINNLYPKFIFKSKHYGLEEDNYNIFPYIFSQNKISKIHKNEINNVFLKSVSFEDDTTIYLNSKFFMNYKDNNNYPKKNNFKYINRLLNIYFKINPILIEKSNNILNSYSNILGLHYRGTDKINSNENYKQITNDLYILILKELIKKYKFNVIFLATDDYNIENIIKNNINIKILKQQNIIKYKNKPIHFSNEINGKDKTQQAFIDCLCLTKCNYVLITNSALGGWSKILNHNLKIFKLHKNTQDWFPMNSIEYYKSQNKLIQNKLNKLQQ